MKTTMKPETIKRRAKARCESQAARTESLKARLAEKAKDDPGGIYTEMLAEMEATS